MPTTPKPHPLSEQNRKLTQLLTRSGELGKLVGKKANGIPDPAKRNAYLKEQLNAIRSRRMAPDGTFLDRPIVGIREFLTSPQYLDAGDRLWPKVLDIAEEMNSGKYTEAVLTGGIGCAKTTLALYSQAYQLYVLSCYTDPHRPFDLDRTSEIEIIFQSLNRTLAADVDFDRFKAIIDEAPYFQTVFPYDQSIKTKLIFPKRIIVRPVTGESSGAIGQNVIGGIIDEINFMAQIEKSKKNPDGGIYDQAVENYNAIARRRESRFMKAGGFLPGMLCVVSSARYRGQFTDRKREEVDLLKKEGKPCHVFVYNKRVWDISPEGRFAGTMFQVFPGTDLRKPYIVEGDVVPSEADMRQMVEVPTEYYESFRNDIMNSLRDIAGISTTAVHPFIMEPEKVVACFEQHPSIFSGDWTDFEDVKCTTEPDFLFYPKEPRFVHIDLALNRDSCGVAIGCVPYFTEMDRGDHKESLPVIHVDGLMEIRAPRGGEIIFQRVRQMVYNLESRLRIAIQWVTFDQWQSVDSQQDFRRKGYEVGEVSLDRYTDPYDVLKQALYDGRVIAPRHDKCLRELLELEIDVTRGRGGKIDHRPDGSKDVADALAGIVYGLSRRRLIWAKFGFQGYQIPVSLRKARGEVEGR